MSKLRENVVFVEGDLESPAEGDLAPYVIFTQLAETGPHIYAGWLDAADAAMALRFAREHYGQDQECVSIRAIPRTAIAGTEAKYPTSAEAGPVRPFEIFIQKRRGDQYVSAGSVDAANSAQAMEAARGRLMGAKAPPHGIWVVPHDEITATGADEIIWRLTDQTYRLARGYSTDVRNKWERIRAEKDIQEYEKEDLKEMF